MASTLSLHRSVLLLSVWPRTRPRAGGRPGALQMSATARAAPSRTRAVGGVGLPNQGQAPCWVPATGSGTWGQAFLFRD